MKNEPTKEDVIDQLAASTQNLEAMIEAKFECFTYKDAIAVYAIAERLRKTPGTHKYAASVLLEWDLFELATREIDRRNRAAE